MPTSRHLPLCRLLQQVFQVSRVRRTYECNHSFCVRIVRERESFHPCLSPHCCFLVLFLLFLISSPPNPTFCATTSLDTPSQLRYSVLHQDFCTTDCIVNIDFDSFSINEEPAMHVNQRGKDHCKYICHHKCELPVSAGLFARTAAWRCLP